MREMMDQILIKIKKSTNEKKSKFPFQNMIFVVMV